MNENQDTPEAAQVLDMQPSEKLMEECCGMRLSIYGHWPSGTKALGKDTKQRIAESENIDVSQISASMRLYDSTNDLVAKSNELNRRITGYVRSMTLPLAKAGVSEISAEGGVYLAKRSQVDDIHKQMVAFDAECAAVTAQLNENRAEVLESCRQKLKDKYSEALYPDQWQLQIRWGFPNIDIPRYLEKLAPQAYAHELQSVQKRLDDTLQLATEGLLTEFSNVVDTWVEKLTPVMRIYPAEGHTHHQYYGAEIFERTTNVQDPQLEVGQVKLVIRHKPGNTGPLLKTSLPVMSAEQYAELKPIASSKEKKKLYTSTVESMFEVIERFRNLGGSISADKDLMQLIEDAANNLKNCHNPEAAHKELKNSAQFREQTRNLMNSLSEKLDDHVTVVSKRRRKISLPPLASGKSK